MDHLSLCQYLHRAYLDARQNKRSKAAQLAFERNLEGEIIRLSSEILSRTYELSPSNCFINEKPVKREVVAANFRDRVVHHLLYNWIAPIFERQFIYDSYSCRVGKGTHFGIERARNFVRSASDNFQKEAWVLRLDISGFFMHIDREILHNLLITSLIKAKWRGVPDVPLCEYLTRKIVFHDPLANARFKSPPGAWRDLPKSKSLMGSPPNCGLPIGNLTSQLFANVYLNPLDHFVKRNLKMNFYGRYVDDMVLVHPNKTVLADAIPKIRDFLQGDLRLSLHPKKIHLQEAARGFAFLGAWLLPGRVRLGRRILGNLRDALRNPCGDAVLQCARVRSYMGM
jgi:retron-type reverse transcriptase